jgi:hypothetical protein
MTCEDRLNYAEEILTSVIDCGTRDLECIFEMEKAHEGTIERAVELKDELESFNFGNFVMAVKDKSLHEIEDLFLELFEEDEDDRAREHIDSFHDMIIDDNYCAWGGISSYGQYNGEDDFNQELQDRFGEFVSGSLTEKEFLDEAKKLLEADKKEKEEEEAADDEDDKGGDS